MKRYIVIIPFAVWPSFTTDIDVNMWYPSIQTFYNPLSIIQIFRVRNKKYAFIHHQTDSQTELTIVVFHEGPQISLLCAVCKCAVPNVLTLFSSWNMHANLKKKKRKGKKKTLFKRQWDSIHKPWISVYA